MLLVQAHSLGLDLERQSGVRDRYILVCAPARYRASLDLHLIRHCHGDETGNASRDFRMSVGFQAEAIPNVSMIQRMRPSPAVGWLGFGQASGASREPCARTAVLVHLALRAVLLSAR